MNTNDRHAEADGVIASSGISLTGSKGTDQRKVRYAVVGIGSFAQSRVLPGMRRARNAELVALVSGDREKARRFQEKYGVPYTYTYEQLHECLSNSEIDAVYIVLPNALHRDFTVWSAAYGKHVLCEKPMANTVAECDDMIAACRRHQVKLMIGYRMHFEPANLRMRELLGSSAIGDVKLIHSTMSQADQLIGDPEQWRLNARMSGGGPVADLGVYAINEASWLLSERPCEVQAHVPHSAVPRFRQVPESATFRLSFPTKGDVVASCSYGVARTSWVEVMGDQGRLRLDPAYHYNRPLQLCIETESERKTEPFPMTDQVALEIEHFSRCIVNDREPEPSGEEGRRDRAVIDAIFESARHGGAVQLHW